MSRESESPPWPQMMLGVVSWTTAFGMLAMSATLDWQKNAWVGVVYLASAGILGLNGSRRVANSRLGAAVALLLACVVLVSLALHYLDVW